LNQRPGHHVLHTSKLITATGAGASFRAARHLLLRSECDLKPARVAPNSVPVTDQVLHPLWCVNCTLGCGNGLLPGALGQLFEEVGDVPDSRHRASATGNPVEVRSCRATVNGEQAATGHWERSWEDGRAALIREPGDLRRGGTTMSPRETGRWVPLRRGPHRSWAAACRGRPRCDASSQPSAQL
jgi:hypothetical protein